MLELIFSELVKSSAEVAKDFLSNLINEKNKELLKEKIEKSPNLHDVRKIPHANTQNHNLLLEEKESVDAELIHMKSESIEKLTAHTNNIKRWSGDINFRDLLGAKKLNQIYIELDTYLMPLRTHFDSSERKQTKPLQKVIFEKENHCLILGQPGAGKTTAMKKLCSRFFQNELSSHYRFPILIRFRDLQGNTGSPASILDLLVDLFSFEIYYKDEDNKLKTGIIDKDLKERWEEKVLITMIDQMSPIIILDGFDELPSHEEKQSILSEIRTLNKSLKKSKVITTCRTGEFNYTLEHTDTFEISPLTSEQIFSFAHKWIKNDEKAKKFIDDIERSPFSDTAIKPLSLAHLCAIYERIGSIPDRPKTVYRKVVGLMLEEWDEQRSVKRVSRYSKFESDRKFEFLTHLSYYLTTKFRTTVFTKDQLVDTYLGVCKNFSLPENQSVSAAR